MAQREKRERERERDAQGGPTRKNRLGLHLDIQRPVGHFVKVITQSDCECQERKCMNANEEGSIYPSFQ